MTRTRHHGFGRVPERVRRAVRIWVVVATALALAAPIWLGPAAPWILRELGASEDHHCACGMQKGKCGCLECAADEAQAKRAKERHAEPILKSSCSSDDDVPFFAALPVVALPSSTLVPIAGFERLSVVQAPISDPSRERGPPVVPPPESVSVTNLFV